jgi:hypothetical protein
LVSENNHLTFRRWGATGTDPGFQVRGGGAHLKKLRRAEGGGKIFGVFHVKNHDFTPKNQFFSNFRGGGRPPDPPLRYVIFKFLSRDLTGKYLDLKDAYLTLQLSPRRFAHTKNTGFSCQQSYFCSVGKNVLAPGKQF